MGKKSRTKKERRQANSNYNKDPMKWEDLVKMKDETISHMVASQQMIGTIFQSYGLEGEGSKDIRESVLGMMKTYQDVIPKIQNIMKQHAEEFTEKEDGTAEFKFKSGVIKEDSNDLFDAINIANQYQEISEVIADITSVGYTDLFTKLREIDPNIKEDMVAEINKATSEGKQAVINEQLKLATSIPSGAEILNVTLNQINKGE